MRADQLTPVVARHGEGIGWHRAAAEVRFVDLLAGDVLVLRGEGVVERIHVGSVAAAWRPRTGGGMVVAVDRGFALVAADGTVSTAPPAWQDTSVRMNDGACDPQGRFYAGSMAYDARPGASCLWRLDPDGSVHRVLEGLTISNGLVWSRDGASAFHVDTPTGRIDRYLFDGDSGSFGERSTVAVVRDGAPDGMTIDRDGGLWVALWGGGAVHRYEPDGGLTAVVEVAARQVTSCGFGGPDLDHLYITTSSLGLPPGSDPTAGAVFVVDPGTAGVPLHEFGG